MVVAEFASASRQPVQLTNLCPESAVADSDTSVPSLSETLHAVRPVPDPQFSPFPETWPFVGVGDTSTVKVSGRLNDTPTVLSASTRTVQAVPPPEQAPLQSFTT